MVTGSFASAIHGQPRATRGLDVVIDPEGGVIDVLVAAFPPGQFYVGEAIEAVRLRDMCNIIDTRSGWKVDLIVRKARPFSESEFSRRVPAEVAGVQTFVTTPEDAILSKLEWQRISSSDLQRRDVVEMLIANADGLDSAYLDHWAGELGVRELLDQLRAEAATQLDR